MSSTEAALSFVLDGQSVTLPAGAPRVLADALAENCGRSGVRVACDHGVCGSCTVLVDGRPTTSCSSLVDSVAGCNVTTIQGLRPPGAAPSVVQQAFVDARAFQCGMCTPGMILLAEALLQRHDNPSRGTIRAWMSANVCRCTGYRAIEDAVVRAAAMKCATPIADAWRPEDMQRSPGSRSSRSTCGCRT